MNYFLGFGIVEDLSLLSKTSPALEQIVSRYRYFFKGREFLQEILKPFQKNIGSIYRPEDIAMRDCAVGVRGRMELG